MVTEEYGTELQKAHGPHRTRKDRDTECRLVLIISDNRGPLLDSISLCANKAHAVPGTKAPAAGKPSGGAASVTPIDEQGGGSARDARTQNYLKPEASARLASLLLSNYKADLNHTLNMIRSPSLSAIQSASRVGLGIFITVVSSRAVARGALLLSLLSGVPTSKR